MKEIEQTSLMKPLNLLPVANLIDRIENLSDSYMTRMRVYLKNGYSLSIIRGEFSYGGNQGLFEIAPFDKNEVMDGKLLNFDYDDVEGYLSKEDVLKKLIQLSEIKV